MKLQVGKCYDITWSEDTDLSGTPFVNKVRVVKIGEHSIEIQDLESRTSNFETSESLYNWRELSELEKALL